MVVGGASFVADQIGATAPESKILGPGSALVAVAIDGKLVGHIVMADACVPVRLGCWWDSGVWG